MMTDTAWLERRKMKIGDKFNLYERDFEIVGTYEPSAGARIKIPLSTMQAQLGSEGKASAFLVKIKDGFTPEAVGDNLHAKFPDNQVILTSELEELYMQGIPALNVFLNVVIGVAGAISALIILLTMYTTVTERTRQIGVLKSLGMSNNRHRVDDRSRGDPYQFWRHYFWHTCDGTFEIHAGPMDDADGRYHSADFSNDNACWFA